MVAGGWHVARIHGIIIISANREEEEAEVRGATAELVNHIHHQPPDGRRVCLGRLTTVVDGKSEEEEEEEKKSSGFCSWFQ